VAGLQHISSRYGIITLVSALSASVHVSGIMITCFLFCKRAGDVWTNAQTLQTCAKHKLNFGISKFNDHALVAIALRVFPCIMPPQRLLSPILRSRLQLSHKQLQRLPTIRHASTTEQSPPTIPWKTPHSITAWPPEPLIPPPKEGEILLERKPNRELPPYVYNHIHLPPKQVQRLTRIPAPLAVSPRSSPPRSSRPSLSS